MKSLILFTLLSFYVVTGTESCNPPVSVPPCDTNMWSYTYGPMERFGEPSPRGQNPTPPRSKLYHRCVTLRGEVMHIARDVDGDMKVKLRLFPTNFFPYTSERESDFDPNKFNGWMTVEVVCAAPKVWRPDKQDWSPVTDVENENAYKVCKNYTNPHHLPELGPGNGKDMQTGDTRVEVGDNITVTGELVTDTGPCDADPGPAGHCHGWKEIHPVTEFRKLRTTP